MLSSSVTRILFLLISVLVGVIWKEVDCGAIITTEKSPLYGAVTPRNCTIFKIIFLFLNSFISSRSFCFQRTLFRDYVRSLKIKKKQCNCKSYLCVRARVHISH